MQRTPEAPASRNDLVKPYSQSPSLLSPPILWDAVEIVDFSRKHTANVYESVADIRGIIARLIETRDAHKWDLSRRDGFVQVVKKAMETRLGSSSDEVLKVLTKQGITRTLAKEALEVAGRHGAGGNATVWPPSSRSWMRSRASTPSSPTRASEAQWTREPRHSCRWPSS